VKTTRRRWPRAALLPPRRRLEEEEEENKKTAARLLPVPDYVSGLLCGGNSVFPTTKSIGCGRRENMIQNTTIIFVRVAGGFGFGIKYSCCFSSSGFLLNTEMCRSTFEHFFLPSQCY